MNPMDVFVIGVAALTVVGFGLLWFVIPAVYLWEEGRPEGLEGVPRWKLAVALPMIGMALAIATIHIDPDQKASEEVTDA